MTDSESKIQGDSVKLFNKDYPQYRGLFFSVHNNASSGASGSVALALGRVAGVSDTIFLSPYGPLLIEFKDEKGKQKPEQVKFQAKAEEAGYTYIIIRSVEEFEYAIKTWLEVKGSYMFKQLFDKKLWEIKWKINRP